MCFFSYGIAWNTTSGPVSKLGQTCSCFELGLKLESVRARHDWGWNPGCKPNTLPLDYPVIASFRYAVVGKSRRKKSIFLRER